MDNETKHTPGPWEYNKDSRWPQCIVSQHGAPGALSLVRICEVRYLSPENARVIELAPTMAQALRDVLPILETVETEEWLEGDGAEAIPQVDAVRLILDQLDMLYDA